MNTNQIKPGVSVIVFLPKNSTGEFLYLAGVVHRMNDHLLTVRGYDSDKQEAEICIYKTQWHWVYPAETLPGEYEIISEGRAISAAYMLQKIEQYQAAPKTAYNAKLAAGFISYYRNKTPSCTQYNVAKHAPKLF